MNLKPLDAGMAEVLRDNSAQTIMPNLVHADQLEKANGRLWSIEAIANTFVGPPLGSLLLLGAFALPFFVDAGSFFVAAALVALIPGDVPRRRASPACRRSRSRPSSREGVRWLMRHPLLRPMAIILGLMNAAGMVSLATFVLFAQEVLDIGPFLFSVHQLRRRDRRLDRRQHRLVGLEARSGAARAWRSCSRCLAVGRP